MKDQKPAAVLAPKSFLPLVKKGEKKKITHYLNKFSKGVSTIAFLLSTSCKKTETN